ncbi:MAG TPA: hypothetical protein VMF55_09895, partial [Solirubrobacterales bacterium]|nr:hypothetical protein [Solirubrobacterales bacterium]
QLAVDGTTHRLYVVTNDNGGAGSLKAYDAAGEPAEFAALGAPEILAPSGGEFCGVAVDSQGDIYVGDYGNGVSIFSPTGEAITTVPVPGACNVAVDESGDLYVNHWSQEVERFVPSEFPPTAAVAYSSSGTVGGPRASSVYASPDGGPVLVDEGERITEFAPDGQLLGRFANSGAGAIGASEGVAYGAGGEVAYAADSTSGRVKIFGPSEAAKPRIESESVRAVNTTEATLEAVVDPEGDATEVSFEYGPGPCSSASCAATAPIAIGAGEASVGTTRILRGLSPGKSYFYRAVARSSAGTTVGADRQFGTESEPASSAGGCANEATRNELDRRLPDCRAFELVSPLDKEGNDIRSIPDVQGLPSAIDQYSSAGDRFTFSTYGAFAGASSNPWISQYLATRGTQGWTTRNLTPPRDGPDEELANEFKLFSPDLARSWIVHTEGPSLGPGGLATDPTLYERQTDSGSYTAVNTTADVDFLPGRGDPIEIQGVGGGHTVFRVPVGAEDQYQVFDRFDGALREVSVLPGGAPYPGRATAGAFGTSGQGGRGAVLDHAVSADGSRIYWTGMQGSASPSSPIYLRVEGRETLPVSETVDPGSARFWTASTDGSRALFSFASGARAGGLYEYSEASGTSQRIAGELVGVVGAAADLSRFYFVSLESLGGEGTAGTPNLYTYGGGSVELVATLSPRDVSIAPRIPSLSNPYPTSHSAAVSPDGDVVVFNSLGRPTGYDNRDVESGEADNEVYRFDAATSQLTCISCQPTDARPEGREIVPAGTIASGLWSAAQVPTWQTPLREPRVIADGGDRVFFDAYSPLLARDGNGQEDVYEWEAAGTGSCSGGSADYSARNGGCLALISTGADPLPSEFLDAGADGHDVFFATAQSLVGADPGFFDVYDARELGGFAEPPAAPAACEGDACQGAAAAGATARAGSSSFVGRGNPVRHKHRRHGKRKRKHGHRSKHHGHGHRHGKDAK